jgi:uncharacterized protein (UPF0261 family)
MPVYVVGTLDTKAAELAYAVERVKAAGAQATLVDISTTRHGHPSDVSAEDVMRHHPQSARLGSLDRGKAVTAMGNALTAFILTRTDIDAIMGLGGSGNTAMVTAAMRALPVGIPKLMVSTVASGNIQPFVGASDIMMMHAVADIAGLNGITRAVIGNAAHAAAGMALNRVPRTPNSKLPVGLTMFGVTTQAVTNIRTRIESRAECFVFHATGTGGQCMEKLIDSGLMSACFDITTTEVADHLLGGVLPCTDDRFGAMIRMKIPYVGSVGACDMVNFGARDTIPARYHARKFHVHNPQVTLMRTTPGENKAIGNWIVERLNRMEGPAAFLLPLRGVSAIDAPGQPFHDPDADAALFGAIREGWRPASNRELIELDCHINDAAFADRAVSAFHAMR